MRDFEKLWETRLKNIKEDKKISEHNKKLLLKYFEYKKSEGVGYRRLLRVSAVLVGFIKGMKYLKGVNKNLDEVTEEDLREFIINLEKSKYAEWTKYTYKVVIKNFYRYLNEGELPKMCKFINMSRKKVAKKLPDDIWSEEEIYKLVNSTREPFWKAFISLGFESGARIGELLNMKIKDIHFNDFGARIRLEGKTGVREIPIIKSIPYLSIWLKTHPDRDNPNAWLWQTREGKRITDYSIRKMLRKLSEKVGIKKKCNPHLVFRHSRATQLANYLTESQLKQYFGWTQDSKMAGVYVHLSGKDLDNAVLGIYGMTKKKEEKIQNGLPIKCPRCSFPNEPNSKFCGNCGLALNTKTAIEEGDKREIIGATLNKLLEKENFVEYLAKALKVLFLEQPELLKKVKSVVLENKKL